MGPLELGNLFGWHLERCLRNAKASSVTNAPNTPTLASHQMCRSPEADDDGEEGADKAGGAVFALIASYARSGPGLSCFACPVVCWSRTRLFR
jgi:hypothetical protein